MDKKPKGEVKRLLRIIGEIQNKSGEAEGYHGNDRDPEGFTKGQILLREIFELCLEASAPYDPEYLP